MGQSSSYGLIRPYGRPYLDRLENQLEPWSGGPGLGTLGVGGLGGRARFLAFLVFLGLSYFFLCLFLFSLVLTFCVFCFFWFLLISLDIFVRRFGQCFGLFGVFDFFGPSVLFVLSRSKKIEGKAPTFDCRAP